MKERAPKWKTWEREAEKFLHTKYPAYSGWVKENLELLKDESTRWPDKPEDKIVKDAIEVTESFASQSGIGVNRREDGVLHIPSRLEAIREFESGETEFSKLLSVDKMVKIYITAEATNLTRAINHYGGTDKAFDYLKNLTDLLNLLKELRGY